jgi:4-diphosphocytidyl-2C-methyl-D-erythritol kinase
MLDADALSTWGSIGRLGGNDFETVVFGKHPELRTLYERMAETGPVWLRLCGSGSAVAAVYKKQTERDDAMQRLGSTRQHLIATATRGAPAPGVQPL